MDLAEAQSLARRLMNAYGLGDWMFQFDRARRRFGRCRYSPLFGGGGTISLSEPLTRLNDVEQVEDVIRHEIAHALAGHEAGHGPAWKAKAREVGARPERCYSSDAVVAPPAPWKLACSICGYAVPRHRRTRTVYTHAGCGGTMWYRRAGIVAAS